MTTFLVRGGYIRVKSEINITRMEIPAVRFASPDRPCAAYAGACLVLTGEAAAHISCRNEMMQRTALCAILLLKRW
jgi:hypothetical protein